MAADPPKGNYPFFTLSNSTASGLGFLGIEKPLPPPPCVEVLHSEASSMETLNVDSVIVTEELTLLKGRVNTSDVFGLSNSDVVPGKYEGGLKLWEGSLDLVKALKSETELGCLSIDGKRVLELGCGHGLPGIFACLKGAGAVHFQDFNAEVLRCLTISNVKLNLPDYSFGDDTMEKKERKSMPLDVSFFAGDWREVHNLLCKHEDECRERKYILEQKSCGDYDVILMSETVYSLSTIRHLYDLIRKCLSWPHGVVYLAGKKHYFGVGGGTRQFLHIVKEEGAMAATLLAEVADGSSNVREVWKFSFLSNEIGV